MTFPPLFPKLCRSVAAVLLCAAAGGAFAADQIVSVRGKEVEAFAVADNAQPGTMVTVSGLPWVIKEEKNSFYRIALQGKDAWVDAMQVTVARGSSDACPPSAPGRAVQPVSLAGAPGAGPARCK